VITLIPALSKMVGASGECQVCFLRPTRIDRGDSQYVMALIPVNC
jgi:hypothetical protein